MEDVKLNSTGSLSYRKINLKPRKKIDAVIYFSYRTPIGYQIIDQGNVRKTVVVNHSYSKTTTTHINKVKEILYPQNGIMNLFIENFIKEGLKDGMDLREGANPMELNKVNPFTKLL